MDKLRVLLVGCGYIAQAEHIGNWVQSRKGTLVGVVDAREGLAQQTGEALGVPWFTEVASALQDCECEAVHICTPVHTHPELIQLAAKMQRHVLVEKPLATTSEAAVAAAGAARQAGVICMVGYHKFFDTDLGELTRRLHAGDLGRLLAMQSVWKLSLPPVYQTIGTWRRTILAAPELSPATLLRHKLLDESIHHLSMFRRWAGKVLQVEAVQQAGSLWHVTLTFEGNIPAWHTNASALGQGDEIRVFAEEGIYEATPWSPHFPWTFGASRIMRKTGETVTPALARANPYAAQLEEFVSAVRENRTPRADAAEAVEDIRLVERIVEKYESAGGGA